MHSATVAAVATVRRMMRFALVGLVAALLLAALALVPPVATVRAAVPIVTNCRDDGSTGSLRQVLGGLAGGETVTFAQDCTGANVITLLPASGGTLTISTNVTIDATAPLHAVQISGNNAVRLFTVTGGLALRGLTLTDGSSSAGGAILNSGTVTITNSTLSSNITTNSGGAIYNSGGTVTITGSTLSGNTVTAGDGGAIYNIGGTVTITTAP